MPGHAKFMLGHQQKAILRLVPMLVPLGMGTKSEQDLQVNQSLANISPYSGVCCERCLLQVNLSIK